MTQPSDAQGSPMCVCTMHHPASKSSPGAGDSVGPTWTQRGKCASWKAMNQSGEQLAN